LQSFLVVLIGDLRLPRKSRSLPAFAVLLLLVTLVATPLAYAQARYQYIRIGNPQDAVTKTEPGYALMGGGSDLDEVFQWLCGKAPAGDFLVLRAAGDDDYNDYINQLCHANSVATLIIPNREAAADPKVSEIISHAEAVFIAGGDQARYINWWQHSPVQDALNALIAAGKPLGGTSAGLAVLGEYVYSAQGDAPDDDGLASSQALANPYFGRVTVRRDFLQIPLLHNTLTDSHFAKRDRMGRTLVFLARIVQDGWSPHPREIAVDEKSAVLIEGNGRSRVVGSGKGAYFLSIQTPPQICIEGQPLTFRDIVVYHATTGSEFDVAAWKPLHPLGYSLTVMEGKIQSTQPNHEIY
jgi:cyanophycinase